MKIKNKKVFLVAFVIVLLLGLTILVLETTGNINLFGKDMQNNPDQIEDVDYSPPTKEEEAAGDTRKQQIVDEDDPDISNDVAEIAITDASQYDNVIEVRAFVSNRIEDGTCTIIFIKDENKITKEVPAFADATTTPCITLSVPKAEFEASGVWQVEVIYKNSDRSITGSAKTELEVR